MKQKEELEQKLIRTEEKIRIKNKSKEKKELDELIDNFLKLEQMDQIYLYRLINKIEIDKDKNVYIYFNFSKLNSINQNLSNYYEQSELQLVDVEALDEFTKIEELIELAQIQPKSS